MIKILFICHGNICRSPMAEYVMRDLAEKAGLGDAVTVDSAAVSSEEIGNPVYPPARAKLASVGIKNITHRARKMTPADYDAFDLLVCMDRSNLRRMEAITGGDPEGKMSLLMSHCGEDREVADPWYTGNFDATLSDVTRGCTALLEKIKEKNI
ncbi:MAG: low molecular weight phosphotyrosine protein phosphatase [Clostridia bacterium]|nr:low molecular weight phosphotyrosine protein phosphatase [Clostridia bacterium]MBQ2327512.1 low molecular weight phosphotyrosine protein phosphatase [Clostridia bacterium]